MTSQKAMTHAVDECNKFIKTLYVKRKLGVRESVGEVPWHLGIVPDHFLSAPHLLVASPTNV